MTSIAAHVAGLDQVRRGMHAPTEVALVQGLASDDLIDGLQLTQGEPLRQELIGDRGVFEFARETLARPLHDDLVIHGQ